MTLYHAWKDEYAEQMLSFRNYLKKLNHLQKFYFLVSTDYKLTHYPAAACKNACWTGPSEDCSYLYLYNLFCYWPGYQVSFSIAESLV